MNKPATKVIIRDPEVQTYLDKLARALTSGDGKTIATMWEVPAIVVGEEVVSVTSLDQVKKFFGGAREQYNRRGITDTRGELLEVDWVNDDLVNIRVRWPHLDEQGEEVAEEESNYILRRGADGELKMRVALLRGES